MTLTAGTKLGPYEIVAPLGAGGMGEVYRARDARLGRDVAIKALPAAFAQDPERLARFEREARLLASLHHANIAVLHGLEEAAGRRFIVMECVEGESIAQRLERGPIPLGETLEIARAIAAALEAAHEGGIVHRDLKPGNVMVTPNGDVKVLDFGLAKGGASGVGSDPDLSASPTMTYAGTVAGVILGTAAYMSPEQARGKSVDRRTDIWSFGCVFFECLTGRKTFSGETVSDIVARILQTEPDWDTLPTKTPERVVALLRRCLEKDAKRRLRDIGEARIEIEDLIATRSSASGRVPVARAAPRHSLPWVAIAVTALVVALATWFGAKVMNRSAPEVAMRFEVAAPKGQQIVVDGLSLRISPDGRSLAMIAADSAGTPVLWVRSLDALTPKRLPGTEGVYELFWSYDSRSIAFFQNDQYLMKVAADGGTPVRLCETKSGRGGAWSRDGVILFAPYSNGPLYRVSANGGTPVQVTHPDSGYGENGHRFPEFLPDGKHFFFSVVPPGADGKQEVRVGSLDGGPTKLVGRFETGVIHAEPDWLLSTRDLSLIAMRFDARALKVVGEPVVIGDALTGTQYLGSPVVSASRDGSLAFLSRQDVLTRYRWYDVVTGRDEGGPPLPPAVNLGVELTSDDHHAMLQVSTEPTRTDLVMADLDRGVTTRITQTPTNVSSAALAWDASKVAYDDEITNTINVRSLADGSVRTLLPNDHAFKRALGWSPDGRALLVSRLDPATKWDVLVVPVDGSAPRTLLHGVANEGSANYSVDGRWIKYTTDESGANELCVIAASGQGLPYQVTIGGGNGGFCRDGRHLLWTTSKNPGDVMIADIGSGESFTLGPPRLFGHVPQDAGTYSGIIGITHDDNRFLRLVLAEKTPDQSATVLTHWRSAIRKN